MEEDLKFFEDCFGIPLIRPINVIKKFCWIHAISLLFWVAGRVAGGIENKANSVQFQLKLPVWTELGNIFATLMKNGFIFAKSHGWVDPQNHSLCILALIKSLPTTSWQTCLIICAGQVSLKFKDIVKCFIFLYN